MGTFKVTIISVVKFLITCLITCQEAISKDVMLNFKIYLELCVCTSAVDSKVFKIIFIY